MGTRSVLFGVILLGLTGCATFPAGPSVMVLPGAGKPFEQFQVEDAACKQWAARQIGAVPNDAANHNTAVGAAVGTAVGAGLGAALGSLSGQAGAGALIGAAGGLLGGAAIGADRGYGYGWEAQRRYDNAYQQCMYAKGNQIPGVVSSARTRQTIPPPPPSAYPPSPPAAYPPPPPPPY
jgi:hypothetical protein